MIIKEIDGDTFNEFANNHMLKNFFQTKEYGELMSHSDYSVMYIGGYHNNVIVAGSLILYKIIGPKIKYGYAPRGFLLDYYDKALVEAFTKRVKEFFFRKKFAFIKINPEITYAILDFESKSKIINSRNKELVEDLKLIGYDKLKDNMYFESMLPKSTPVIFLPKYDINQLNPTMINEVRNAELSGLKLINGGEADLTKFYQFVEKKTDKTLAYYRNLYNIFSKSNMLDLLLLEINYDTYAKFLQKQYIYEQEKNDRINKDFRENPNNNDLYNKKMLSDQVMAKIQSDIIMANSKMEENNYKEVLGAAIIVKHQGRVTIIITGNNDNFQGIDLKTFLFFKIIEEYQKSGYLYIDLYGITSDFSDKNPYKEFNEFKLKFKPSVYEYIGELDLIVNKPFHQILWSTNQIQREFYKPQKKVINN